MNRPEVNPENHQTLYEYYGQLEPNRWVVRAVHAASSLVYRPRVHFADGAEPEIAERIAQGDRIIVVTNHLTIGDQNALFAGMEQVEALRPLAKQLSILAKPEYFTNPVGALLPLTKRNPLLVRASCFVDPYLRLIFDAAGAIPAFRPKDMPNNRRLQAHATQSLTDMLVDLLVRGRNVVLFPENTRNQGDPSVLQEIHGGVGRIACKASKEVGVSIVAGALWYGEGDDLDYRRPDLFIDHPIVGPFSNMGEANKLIRSAMEDSLRHAIKERSNLETASV